MRGILAIIVFTMGGLAHAAGDPLATVNKVSGLVRVSHAGAEAQEQATAGMPLMEGDRVSTITGRAEVKFANGHLLRLVENSSVEIMAPVQQGKRGFFSRLFAGKVRAIVARMSADESFEIQSPYAVASVKGTDIFFDGRMGSVRDEGDSAPHVLTLMSLDGGTRVEIMEGMTGGFAEDGSVVEPKAAGAEFFEALERAFDVMSSSGSSSSPAPTGDAPGAAIDRETLRADLADFAEANGLGDYSDALEHAGDIALGRVLVDMNGYRVRVEQYVHRPRLDTIQLLILNSREAGPNKGISTMQDDLKFNQDLPDNYEDVRRDLPRAFADPNQEPVFWPIAETQKVASPRGDFIRVQSLFGIPEPVYADFIREGVGGGSFTWYYMNEAFPCGWGQTTDTQLFVGTAAGEALKEHFLYDRYGALVGGWYAGATPAVVEPWYSMGNPGGPNSWWSAGPSIVNGAPLYPPEDPFTMDNMGTPDVDESMPMFNNPQFGTGIMSFGRNARGGYTGTKAYGDGTFLRESFFFVSDNGRVLDADTLFAGADNPDSFAGGLAGGLNFELVWEASEFRDPTGIMRTIDILIAPEIFDELDGGTTPTSDEPPLPPGGGPV